MNFRPFRRRATRRAPPLAMETLPWLMLTASATVAPHFETLPNWLIALAAGLMLWRYRLWRMDRPALGAIVLVLLAVAGGAGVLYEYRTIFGREPGVALLVLLMLLKLLELRATRDGVVIVMLGYFLLLTHYFVADSIPVGLWMLCALVLTTATLIRLQCPAAEPARDTVRAALRLIAQSLPVMLVLFLLFPRITGPLWGLPQDLRRDTTGLSDEMSPGSISELTRSTALAFRVEFPAQRPGKEVLYWRGPVMTEYDGRTWRATRGGPPPGSAGGPLVVPLSPPLPYTITLEPHLQRWLLALDLPTRLPPETGLNATLSVMTRAPVRERLRLGFESATSYRVGEKEAPGVLQRALALPAQGNPRARELAAGWRDRTAGRQDQASFVVAEALRMFREQDFVYTLRPPLLGENPIDEFLFDVRRGFCEHYAAAFVFLMRAAGVPARVVGGYQGGEFNPLDGVLTVRQSDAHAWAEVWMPERGWVRADPTAAIAPSRVEQGLQAALPEGENVPAMLRHDLDWLLALRYRWDAINNAWNIWVIGYNTERQQDLLRRFGLRSNWSTLLILLAAFGALVGTLVVFWILRQPDGADPAQRLWTRACRRLARQGLPRRPDEGPRDYAERIGNAAPEHAEVVGRIAALYIRARYDGDGSKATLRELGNAVDRLPRNLVQRSQRA